MDVSAQLNQINAKLNAFGLFVQSKLSNFASLSIGEKISYPVIGVGVLLILTSLILFII